jgi:sulfite exporter TauE/SafE
VLGMVGSLHCVGMCGPIALALPSRGGGVGSRIISSVVYNIGRVTTYTTMGAIIGIAGGRLLAVSLQQHLSIFFGLILLLFVFKPAWLERQVTKLPIVGDGVLIIRKSIGSLFRQPSLRSLLLIGVLNGLLPCGFVYVAWAGALTSGSIAKGAAFMALFGLGTFPALWAVAFGGSIFSGNVRLTINKVTPFIVGIMALLFVLRGLNLDIPFVSPKIDFDNSSSTHCGAETTTSKSDVYDYRN